MKTKKTNRFNLRILILTLCSICLGACSSPPHGRGYPPQRGNPYYGTYGAGHQGYGLPSHGGYHRGGYGGGNEEGYGEFREMEGGARGLRAPTDVEYTAELVGYRHMRITKDGVKEIDIVGPNDPGALEAMRKSGRRPVTGPVRVAASEVPESEKARLRARYEEEVRMHR
jgi:hypothetical protein